MPFPDLLQWIGESKRSGTLSVSLSHDERFLRFVNGEITAMGSADARTDDLVRIVLGRGLIDEELLRRVLTQRDDSRSLHQTLSDDGHVPAAFLIDAVRSHAKDAVMQLFLWEHGHFVFTAANEPSLTTTSCQLDVRPPLPVAELLMDAMRRLDEWRRINEVFPSDYIMLHAIAGAPDLPAVELLHQIGEPMALLDLCLRIDRPRFAVLAELHEGWKRGMVAAEAQPHEIAAPTGVTSAQHLLDAARALLAESQFDEASSLLRTVLNLDPTHAESRRLLDSVHKQQIEELYREFPIYRVPVVIVDRASASVKLSPRELYLLNRIDGRWDIATLTSLTPMGQLDTLRALKKFQQLNLIRLT